MAENLAMGSLVCFLCFSIHADVLATIVSNHAKQSAGAKTAQIHSVLERNEHLILVQNVNLLHTKSEVSTAKEEDKKVYGTIGEPVSTGGFSDLEFFIISSTVHWMAVVEWDEIETQDVHTIYSAIIQLR